MMMNKIHYTELLDSKTQTNQNTSINPTKIFKGEYVFLEWERGDGEGDESDLEKEEEREAIKDKSSMGRAELWDRHQHDCARVCDKLCWRVVCFVRDGNVLHLSQRHFPSRPKIFLV